MDSAPRDPTFLEEIGSLRIAPPDDDADKRVEEINTGKEPVEEEEEEEDEDDDEEEAGEPVTLGFLEKPKDPRSLLRHFFPSKAGGVPAWLDPLDLPSRKVHTCGFCGEPLQFLLQVYAPVSEKESTFHRTLFVFMCPSMRCLLQDQHEQWKRRADTPSRSVKVFRCQLPLANPFYSSDPPKHNSPGKHYGDGALSCCWCGTWKGEKVCGSCRRARYCSEKHQAMHWRMGHRNECRQIIASSTLSDSSLNVKLPISNKVACNTLWPEFEIISEDECLYNEEVSEDSGSTSVLVTKQDNADEMTQMFMDKFEADGDKKSWASFQECIAKAPEQVLRYCRDAKAKPLWPVSTGRPSKDDIPNCSYCGGPLCCEFQILPQLLYYFEVKNDADSLDWATIIVYSCAASCEASVAYKQEFAWVQLYSSTPIPRAAECSDGVLVS